MKITVTNISTSQVSTDLGLILPNQSKSVNMSPLDAYNAASGLKTLADAGRVLVTVSDEASRLDALERESTTAPMTLFVESTGKDTNPGTRTAPFLTIQAALDSLPKRIRHLVRIQIGIGNFAGFNITGFTMDPLIGTLPCGLSLQGTLIPFVPATGSATGTFTSSSNGSSAALPLSTDSTQTWTVSNLKKKLLKITSGASINTHLAISGNTATAMTFTSLTGTNVGAAGVTYSIMDWGTIVTGTISIPPALNAIDVALGSPAIVGINVSNNTATRPSVGNCAAMERIKFAPTATTTSVANFTDTVSFALRLCDFACTGTGTIVNDASGERGGVRLTACIIQGTSTATAITSNLGTQGTLLSGCVIIVPTTAAGINFNGGANGSVLSNYIEGSSVGFAIGFAGGGSGFSGWITGAVRGIRMGPMSVGAAGTMSISNATNISNCSAAGIDMSGPHILTNATSGIIAGTSNLVGIALALGARFQIQANTTITGTTEVTIDGVSSDLATMRAASPKLITNTYGTIFFQ